MTNSPIVATVRTAPIVFAGTVRRLGEGSFPGIPASERLAVVRVSRGLRVAPSLGKLDDREVTILLDPRSEVGVGYEGVFFADAWIYGKGIAVRELAHRDDSAALRREVTDVLRQLPDLELEERIRGADLVVLATVGKPRKANIKERIDWDAPDWAQAPLKVSKVLGGHSTDDVALELIFPRARTGHFARSPKFKGGERAIILLRPFGEGESGEGAAPDAWTALDPRDVIDPARLDFVTKTLSAEVK